METASSSHDDDDLGLVLTPVDSSEVDCVIATDDNVEGLILHDTAAGAGVEVRGGDGETGTTTALSSSASGAFRSLSAVPLLAGTDSPPVFSLMKHRPRKGACP